MRYFEYNGMLAQVGDDTTTIFSSGAFTQKANIHTIARWIYFGWKEISREEFRILLVKKRML